MSVKYPRTAELLSVINEWSQPLIDHPAFRQLVRSKIRAMLDWQDEWPSQSEFVSEVVLPEPLAAQHDAIMKFYNLWQSVERLKSVEHYFRRYPFKGSDVARHEHLENICAMFFSYFYVIQERLRLFLNAINQVSAPGQIDVGKALKAYQRQFRAELRERHGATHFEPFDDLTINAVMMRTMVGQNGLDWQRRASTAAYRKASKEWAGHARQGSEKAAAFLELIAAATLDVAPYLRSPPSLAAEDLKAV